LAQVTLALGRFSNASSHASHPNVVQRSPFVASMLPMLALFLIVVLTVFVQATAAGLSLRGGKLSTALDEMSLVYERESRNADKREGRGSKGPHSAEAQDQVNVVYFIEGTKWAAGLQKSVASILENTMHGSLLHVQVFVFDQEDLSAICHLFGMKTSHTACTARFRSRSRLTVRMMPQSAVNWVEVVMTKNFTDFDGDSTNTRLKSLANFGRFALAKVLPSSSQVAVCLDVDTLVVGDIVELAQGAMQSFPKASVMMSDRPPYNKQTMEIAIANKTYADLHIQKELRNSTMFNAGMMVINLPRWRSGEALGRMLKWMSLSTSRHLFFGGNQAAIDMGLLGTEDLGVLSWQWHCFNLSHLTRDSVGQCKMFHFSGAAKPWSSMNFTNPVMEEVRRRWDSFPTDLSHLS